MKTYDEQTLRDLIEAHRVACVNYRGSIVGPRAVTSEEMETVRKGIADMKEARGEAWNALNTYLKTGEAVSIPLSDEVLKGLDAAARLQ